MNMIATPPSRPLPPVIPDNAPFSAAQRAWLNGFFAGLLGSPSGSLAEAPAEMSVATPPEAEDIPWHDPGLELPERMQLAEGRPLPQRLMAAMGQLDCGQCGFDCQSYAAKLADRSEAKTSLCVPGGRATRRMLDQLLAEIEAPPMPMAAPAAPVGRAVVTARLKAAAPLSAPDSPRDTRHVVIDLADTGFTYEPGDSLGVMAQNDTELVSEVATLSGAAATELAGRDLRQITDLLLELLAEAAEPAEKPALRALLVGEDPDRLLEEGDVLDLLRAFPSARPEPAAIVAALDELQPRLYSISSSQAACPDEVHLTVGVVREERRGRLRRGVASTFLAERLPAGGALKVYRQPSHGFRLPVDPTVPIVMIGPGTGVAPFRAFLQERARQEGRGPAWLFFGNPNAGHDFLYREEIESWLAEDVLTRLDTAFSRDQAEKIYVQHRIEEHGAELWGWLEEGAHLYVCGDAKRMAKDVDTALRRVVASHGGRSSAEADAYIAELARAKRYQRDVY